MNICIKSLINCTEAIILLVCLVLAFLQLREIFRDFVSEVTTTVIKEDRQGDSNGLPFITVCPMSGYKGDMQFNYTEEDFLANTYEMEELFGTDKVLGE